MTAPAGFQQQPMHPTVPYGQPGAPPAVILPPTGGQPGTQMPAQQQPNPAGWGQPGAVQPGAAPYPQQPQFPVAPVPTFPAGQQPPYAAPQPQPAQYPQQQQQQQGSIPDHVVLDGPGIPPELRGRTFGQMKQIYGALATEFIQRQGRGPQQQQQAPQQQQQQIPQQVPQQQRQAPQADDETRQFWERPAAFIREAVRQEASTLFAPVAARTQAQAIQEARHIASMGIPDFQMLEPEMIQSLTQLDPAALSDPRTWSNVADLTRGRMMAQNRYGQLQQIPQQPQFRPAGPGSYVPAPMAPIPQAPLPQGQFFSEAPTPPQPGWFTGSNSQRQLNPEQQSYARKMGMTDQQYMDWTGGVQPTQSSRRF